MTTSELHIGHAYVVHVEKKGLCIALAVRLDRDEPLMCLREGNVRAIRWCPRPRSIPYSDIRRPATKREVALAFAL